MSDPDIAVLRQKIHGMPAADYADEIRPRLPDHEVAVATTPEEERELLRTVRVATGITFPTELLPEASNLELFACAYAGTSHLDVDEFAAHDVAVTSASGVHGPNIAEYAVGAMVYFTRGFGQAREQQEQRRWQSYPGDELMGSTVTVVGLGAIGETLVDRLDPFGVETLGVRYSPEKGGPTDEVFGFDEIHEALARTDYLVLACPLTETTRGLLGDDEFRTLPAESLLINVARGPVVDTDALLGALRSNDVRGAVLDVTDPEPLPENHPLWGFDDVLITPHNAGHTPKYYDRLADILAENVERAAETGAFEELENQVV
ncbi:D-2-hydroxyacid dehydrogenase [Haloplanus sp. GCM10025708]|uniref:D-2-hydroxyacid dehydrogenase n=1 Tax=Haloferacaceae TaxID=1644056 RepID=UPI00360CFD2F